MMNAVFKAFTGRAGWLPSLLALTIIALIAFTTVTALPRIEQAIETQVQQYLEANLSENDSLVGFQVSGRDVLLSGRIADPKALQVALMNLSGVRRVVIHATNRLAPPPVDQPGPASQGAANSELPAQAATAPATTAQAVTAQAVTVQAVTVPSDEVPAQPVSENTAQVSARVPESSSNSPDSGSGSGSGGDRDVQGSVTQNAASSTGQGAVSDDAPPPAVSGVRPHNASAVIRSTPETLILSLNQQFLRLPAFTPGDSNIRAELAPLLVSLAEMMRQNPGVNLGIEGYPDTSVDSDKSAFIGFVRARNAEKFLLEQQLEDARISTRYLRNDQASADEGLQLKLYILK